MKKYPLLLAAALFALPATAVQAADANVFVIHGIPGEDLGLDADLPVDISVSGACALQGFTFGRIEGPIQLPAPATYKIEISLANSADPCGNDPVIKQDVNLLWGQTATIIAHLTEFGEPTASAFGNNVRELDDEARVAVHHTAAAGPVDVKLRRVKSKKSIDIEDLANGDQVTAEIKPGGYVAKISPAGSRAPVFGPARIRLEERVASFLYAVGTPGSTFDVLRLDIDTGNSGDDDDEDDEDDEDD